MGTGYSFHCNHCGASQEAWLGVGMMFPTVCEETLAEAREGKYGQKLKEAAESEPFVGVSAEQRIYVCGKCGHWEVRTDASVYGLADKVKGPDAPFGEKTIAEWGDIPYVAKWVDEGMFRLIEEYAPDCPECGGPMCAQDVDEGAGIDPKLRCNSCGYPLSPGDLIVRWD